MSSVPRTAGRAIRHVAAVLGSKAPAGHYPAQQVLPVLPSLHAHLVLSSLLLSWISTAASARESNVTIVSSSSELYAALGTNSTSVVYLTGTLRLASSDWATPLSISRNVTIAAHPRFQAIHTYITLDLSNLVARVNLQPGVELRFVWLELLNYVAELDQTVLLVGASPGAAVVFDTVVQRRRAGLSGERLLQDILALPPPPGREGKQQAFLLPRFDFNTSREATAQSLTSPVFLADVASVLPPTSSRYFAQGVALGQYLFVALDTAQVSDVVVSAGCTEGASEWDCVTQQLKLLDISPIIIKTKAADSNLVKIVASLAILAVSVLLFLYFRRHYRTYQQRRARRMRRIKEALGAGPEAHGIMFNGLDGDEPDWQIMPMPVGYAAEEGGGNELHQDSNLRALIKDISNRPNRCIPEPAEAEEMRLEVTDCPIAAEVGLRLTPAAAAAAAAATAAAAARGERPLTPADADAVAAASPVGPHRAGSRGEGPDGVSSVVGSKGFLGSGGTGTAPLSAGSGITAGTAHGLVSHASISGTSGSRATGPLLPPPPMGGTAGGAAPAGGSHRLAAPPLMVTTAAMDMLLASRAAAVGLILTKPAGGGGSTSREGGGSMQSTATDGVPSPTRGGGGTTAAAPAGPGVIIGSGSRETPRSPAQERTSRMFGGQGGAEAPGSGSGGGGGGGGGGGSGAATTAAAAAAAAAASRHAVTYAAADVAQRVMRSRDSDDGEREEEDEEEGGGQGKEAAAGSTNAQQAARLMDELESLRRDIMSGINDTQLQIMSVVGSGAFGTVYRGQWQGLEVAVKTVVFSASSENRKRALQEAALCQSINHRNIVATYAVDVQPLGAVNTPVLLGVNPRNSTLSNLLDWRLYIVQEYCDGGPLRKVVQSQYLQTSNGPNMPVICEVALELAQALAHLHSKNIIHGDLNPNNVLLKRDASSPIGFRVKMADFGLSVMVPLQKTHMSNLRLGTLYYIAPETCFRGQLGYAADVFSLGVMLWELYHGRLAGTRTPTGEPRYQPDFPDFPATCPPDYRKLAHRCLQKQPHNRLHSSQVVQRLQEMLAAYRSAEAAAPPGPPLPPLPLGGPDERPLAASPPTPPTFATAAAATGTGVTSPPPPGAAAAAAAALPPPHAASPPPAPHQAAVAAAVAALRAAATLGRGGGGRGGASSATPSTPTDSRHRPSSPASASPAVVAAAAAAADVSPEISPWAAS